MKRILIIYKELPELKDNKYVLLKKDKTIIKDYNLMKPEFYHQYDYKFFLEEWEIWDYERVHVMFSNSGAPLRPVHIKSDLTVKQGSKALFQTEKMLSLKMSNGLFELCKSSIDNSGEIKFTVLSTGEYNNIKDVKYKIDNIFNGMFDRVMNNIKKYSENGYLGPLYAKN